MSAITRVPILSGTDSADVFSREFLPQDRPCILKGIARPWRAFEKWTPAFFREQFGDRPVPISNYRDLGNPKMSAKPRMTLKQYIEYIERAERGDPECQQPLYAAGWHYLKDCPELASDLETPPHFKDNWIDRLSSVINFDQTSLFIGHRKAETQLHTDSFFVSTWLVMIRGRKTVRLIPGQYTGYVKNALDTFDPGVVAELFRREIPLYEAVIEEGDAIFMPPGYWHQVRNESLTVAVSNNFVSALHFLTFEQQVRAKLLKPVLGLSLLREQAIRSSARSLEDLRGFRYAPATLQASHYVDNERKYAEFLKGEARRLTTVLDYIEARGQQ